MRKQEREKKRQEKEDEKQRKAELKKQKEEEKAKKLTKPSKSTKTNKSAKAKATVRVASVELHASSDSEVAEDGVQNNGILNDECVVCFGLYQDDLSSTGKLLREWVECTNETCKKWMHSQCLELNEGLFVCKVCGITFS